MSSRKDRTVGLTPPFPRIRIIDPHSVDDFPADFYRHVEEVIDDLGTVTPGPHLHQEGRVHTHRHGPDAVPDPGTNVLEERPDSLPAPNIPACP